MVETRAQRKAFQQQKHRKLTSEIEGLLLEHVNIGNIDVEERLDGLLALDLVNLRAGHLARAVNSPAQVADRRRRIEQDAFVKQAELPQREQGWSERLHKFHVAQGAFRFTRIGGLLERHGF